MHELFDLFYESKWRKSRINDLSNHLKALDKGILPFYLFVISAETFSNLLNQAIR